MALLDAFVFEPFSVNESLLDSLLLEPDQFEFWISATGTSPTASGTECDPYDGSSQMLLDKLMATFPPNTTVHLGPGMFVTNGNNGGWAPKSGQRIVGAGFDETILKLINASSSANLTSAIGAPLIGSSAPRPGTSPSPRAGWLQDEGLRPAISYGPMTFGQHRHSARLEVKGSCG